MEVVHGRAETAGSRGEDRLLLGGPVRRVEQRELARIADRVVAQQALALLGRHAEAGVRHPERLEQPLRQKVREGAARDPGDEHAKDVGTSVVEPVLAGLPEHRDLHQRRKPVVRRRDELRLAHLLLHRGEERLHRRE